MNLDKVVFIELKHEEYLELLRDASIVREARKQGKLISVNPCRGEWFILVEENEVIRKLESELRKWRCDV